MIRAIPTMVTGFTTLCSLSLLRPESLADFVLRVLQEVANPTQGISAAVQHLPGLLLYRPNALRCLRAHPARGLLHVLLHLASPQPHDGCPDDRSQDEGPSGSHRGRPSFT